jgi:cell division protein FtsB
MKSKESPNWLDYWHGDTLSPKKIADELGFDSSAFKEKRNKKLFDLLQDLKQELATSGVYQQRKANLPLDKEVIDVSKGTEEDIKDSAKVRDLKRTNRRLQNENAKLAAEVAKLSEFKEVLIEMGLWK